VLEAGRPADVIARLGAAEGGDADEGATDATSAIGHGRPERGPSAREDEREENHREQRSDRPVARHAVPLEDVLVPRDWEHEGRCRDEPLDVFYGHDTEAARDVCRACPVRHSCLLDALLRREAFGVWGGLGPAERRRLVARVRSVRRVTTTAGHAA
jgi:WhiB family transcriptional regulator, redox-sensing transcriptional regulator